MHLQMPTDVLQGYTSASQRARVSSEAWGERNLYCPSCDSEALERCTANMKSIDFVCRKCQLPYQLKSSAIPVTTRVMDGAYLTMRTTILSGNTPNLLLLHYDLQKWTVRSLTVIPWFAFTLSSLECRPMLRPPARRAGWQGCNILLTNIPEDARVPMVIGGTSRLAEDVRREFAKLKGISGLTAEQRGWTLDVLNVVRTIGKKKFSLKEVCEHSRELQKLHPRNRHVDAKIRQQLQTLRNLGLVRFIDGRGNYEFTG